MNKLFHAICLILVSSLFMLTSCEKDKSDLDSKIDLLDSNDYFPLHTGDYWELDFIPKRTIDKEIEIDGIDYFQQNSEYGTIFYRKTSDGKIYQKTETGNEILKFDLNAEIGKAWTYKFDGSDFIWNATLTSKNETIELDNHTFFNCYRFYFDVPQLADEEHIIWLAPGVGIVEEASFGGTADRKKLNKAGINGVEIHF